MVLTMFSCGRVFISIAITSMIVFYFLAMLYVINVYSIGSAEYIYSLDITSICVFLDNLYRDLGSGYGCLVESPVAEATTCYTSTNKLAVYVLRRICNNSSLAEKIEKFLDIYRADFYDYYQVLIDLLIKLPFNAITHPVVDNVGGVVIKHVKILSNVMHDYDEYANFVAIKAIHHALRGEKEEAWEELKKLDRLFDGVGFKDKAFQDFYETYKLVLAAIAFKFVNNDIEIKKYLNTLYRIKPFTTLYRADMVGVGDLNLETACLTAIALNLDKATTREERDLKITAIPNLVTIFVVIAISIIITIVILKRYLYRSSRYQ